MAEFERQGNPLGYEKISTLVRRFSIPSIVAMIIQSLYNIVDQIYIGHIPDVGILGNAATNVAFPITSICMALTLLVAIGAASNFSLRLGEKKPEEAGEIVGTSLWMIAIIGILYAALIEILKTPLLTVFGATESVLPYAVSYVSWTAIGLPFMMFSSVMNNLVRADGSPRFSMMFMIVGAVTNIILDPIFIFALNLGVAGAAIATVISQILAFAIAFSYLWRFRQVDIRKSIFHPNFRKFGAIASLGLSNSLTQLAITLVQIVMNNSLTYYGAQTIYGADIPLASFGIIMKINAILVSAFVGLSMGCQPIIGFNYGAKQYARVKETYRFAIIWAIIVSALATVLFQGFPELAIGLFGSGNALYMEFATKFMRIFLLLVIVNGVQLISSNFFSAIGKPLKGVLLSLTRQCFALIPMALILPLFMGIDGLMAAGPVADGVAFILSLIVVIREFRHMDTLPAAEEASELV